MARKDRLTTVLQQATDATLRHVYRALELELLARAASKPPRTEFDEVIDLVRAEQRTPTPPPFNGLLKEPSGLWQRVDSPRFPPKPLEVKGDLGQWQGPAPKTTAVLEGATVDLCGSESETTDLPPTRFPPPIVPRSMTPTPQTPTWDPDDEWSERSIALDSVLDSELENTAQVQS